VISNPTVSNLYTPPPGLTLQKKRPEKSGREEGSKSFKPWPSCCQTLSRGCKNTSEKKRRTPSAKPSSKKKKKQENECKPQKKKAKQDVAKLKPKDRPSQTKPRPEILMQIPDPTL
jgi:hypothetical protein